MQYYVLKYKKTVVKKICTNCFIKQYCHFLAIGAKKRTIGNDTTNQQRLFNFFGKTQKKCIGKNEKESRKFSNNKTSVQAKRVCEDLERIAIDKKQKIEKIHKELGQSNRQLSSTTVNDTKEPDQSNLQLSSTTVTDTTNLRIRSMLLSKIFSVISKQNKSILLLLSTTKLQTFFHARFSCNEQRQQIST